MKKRNFLPVLLAALLSALLFCGCSKNATAPGGDLPAQQTAGEAAKPDEAAEPEEPVVDLTLRYQSLPLPAGMGAADGQCLFGGVVYSFGNTYGKVLGYTQPDGSTGTLETPDKDEYLHAICPLEDGFAVLAGTYPMYYEDAAGELHQQDHPEGVYEILRYGADGALVSRTPLRETYCAQADAFYDMAYWDGSYYLLAPHQLTRIGADGTELARTPFDTTCNYQQIDAYDGGLILGTGDIFTLQEIHRIDPETLAPAASFALEGKTLTGIGFDREGKLLVCDATNTVRRVDGDAQEGEKVLSWTENGGTAAQNYVRFYELDGVWIALENNTGVVSRYRVYDGAPPEKIKLTLTEVSIFDKLYTLVDDFNRSNETYEIEVVTKRDPSVDLSLEEQRILADLATNPSDLYAGWLSHSLPLNEQAFVDLVPWLTADGALYDSLVPSLRDRLCADGTAYALPFDFGLFTWYGDAAYFGQPGVTVAELEKITDEAGYEYPLDGVFAAEGQLGDLAQIAPDCYVDWENYTCHFTDPAFIRLLEICKKAGKVGVKPEIIDALVMGDYYGLGALRRRCIQSAVSFNVEYYDFPNYIYVGYPNGSTNGSAFALSDCFAISAKSAHKDGAWEFIRFALSDQEQEKSGNLPFCDETLRRELDEQVTREKLSEQDVQKFYDALYGATILYGGNAEISKIVMDEGTRYLYDEVTAEQAAQSIQSRVSLYLMENQLG